MEAKDIWLLFGGAFLGFIGSLLATFTAPSIGNALGKLSAGAVERNRARALASYYRVLEYKTGKRDRYLYAITHWGLVTLFILTCLTAAFLGMMTGMTFAFHKPEGQQLLWAYWFGIFSIFSGYFVFLRRTIVLLLLLQRLQNFERYRADLLRRWPDLDLPNAE
jgi:hypothetical protein